MQQALFEDKIVPEKVLYCFFNIGSIHQTDDAVNRSIPTLFAYPFFHFLIYCMRNASRDIVHCKNEIQLFGLFIFTYFLCKFVH